MTDQPNVLKRLEEIEARSLPPARDTTFLLNLTRALLESQGELMDLSELAWGVIANAGSGDWTRESQDWQFAAHHWGVRAGYRMPYDDEAAPEGVIARAEKVRKGEV